MSNDTVTSSPDSTPSTSAFRLGIAIVAVLAVALVLYQISLNSMPVEGKNTMLKVVGLDRPVSNRLDDRFADADGDLVADAPADAAQLVSPDELVFSFIPTADPSVDRENWAGFADHLAKTTGRKVRYEMFDSQEKQLAALREGKLHVTVLNTGNVPLAVNTCGFVPVATPGRESGTSGYKMQIITPADSKIRTIRDLRGNTLTLTTPGSNSGYKAPIVILMSDFALEPGDYNMINSFSHEASIAGVASGRYQAAAVASDLLAGAIGRGEVDFGDIREIYKSEPFPSAGLGYVHNLDPELAAKVREAMLTYRFDGSPLVKFYAGNNADRFVSVSFKDDFALIRRIDDAVGLEHKVD